MDKTEYQEPEELPLQVQQNTQANLSLAQEQCALFETQPISLAQKGSKMGILKQHATNNPQKGKINYI